MPASSLSRRRSSGDDDDVKDDKPTRRGRRSEEPAEEEKPTRRGRRSSSDKDGSEEEESTDRRARRSSGTATGGFAAYREKRTSNSAYADEFKPEANRSVLIKFLDDEPFDNYQQHWIDEKITNGKRKSFVCRDDAYFDDDKGCPLCDIGEPASTKSLFNVLDLSSPNKPEVKVWSTSVTVSDKLERLALEKKTSPLDRDDLYFEVTMLKKPKKTEWDIQPVKARDLKEDFDMEPLADDEIKPFLEEKFERRTAVTQVDSYEDLEELADALD